jgi:hypothetical protein
LDYRKFLSPPTELVLPYFGGYSVVGQGRRFRLKEAVAPGWWRFRVEGRKASPLGAAEPVDLSALGRVRGHLVESWLFSSGADVERVELLPAEEPPVFAVVSARRWESGELVFEGVEFEGDAEEGVRRALEERSGIDAVKGVGAGLRRAFAHAVLRKRGNAIGVHVSPLESRARALEVASGGESAADAILIERAHVRQSELERRRFRRAVTDANVRDVRSPRTERNAAERAAAALEHAGASLLGSRRLGNDLLEVTFRFLGERFISVVDLYSLQVYDAGICLSGEDRQVNLDSLPSVIREAMDTDQLNITRH